MPAVPAVFQKKLKDFPLIGRMEAKGGLVYDAPVGNGW